MEPRPRLTAASVLANYTSQRASGAASADYKSRHVAAPGLRARRGPIRGVQAGAPGSGAGLTEGAAAAEDGGGGVRLLSPGLLHAHLPLGVLRILG